MRAFITATGTNIGKTYVACGLLRQLRMMGHPTLALKPVVSGFDPAAAADSDPARLLIAQELRVDEASIAAIAPWRFAAPVSPDWAATLERRTIEYSALLAFGRKGLERTGSVLIEGIGGVMVPLNDTHSVLDLCVDLALPIVLVAGSYLGSLSHTLSAISVLQTRELRCVVVVSPTPGSLIDLDITTATIARHGQVPVLALSRTVPPVHDPMFADIVQLVS